MGRKSRNYFSGAIYHIIKRGNNKTYIFNDQLDKSMFYGILNKTKLEMPFKLLYFVLMDNHYHLLVEMMDISIDKIMRSINLAYSKYFNKKYNRTGTIFDGRLSIRDVNNREYYLKLICYIAFNPVKANLVKNPNEYKWGAHLEIVNKRSIIVDRKEMLKKISNSSSSAMTIYKDIINNSYINKYEKLSLEDKHIEELDVFIKELSNSSNVYNKIKNKNRSKKIIEIKNAFIMEYFKRGYSIKEIALCLNMSVRSIRLITGKSCAPGTKTEILGNAASKDSRL
ncbi:transposase [Helicovermis profundi]|uniref:Transposase IS200-like domain-containing protein n=1 Tax=Helicovermis profundi TaxID=3065157 RepID=A0AAU9EHL8_9FIRM|nr:hypothetical protein HLPR_26630 [Clostridia bacterium S502]